MNFISVIILLGISIVCAYIHKSKGYSPIAGFLWGFFFSLIGLVIILLERTKEEQLVANQNGLSMMQWLLIFLGIGIIGSMIFFHCLTNGYFTKKSHKANSNYKTYTENILDLKYEVPSKFEKSRIMIETDKAYSNYKEDMYLNCVCKQYKEDKNIIDYINSEYNDISSEIEEEEVNGVIWYKFCRKINNSSRYYYITINNKHIYIIDLSVGNEIYHEQCRIYLTGIANSLVFD